MRCAAALFGLGLIAACRSSEPPAPHPSPANDLHRERDPAAYDRYRRPDLLVTGLGLRPGARVADVGAGRGYFEPYLAAAIGPTGHLVATDVDAEALRALDAAARAGGIAVESRLVTAADPGLEAGQYDLILLAQVDHLLDDRAAYLRRLGRALAPGGRIAVSNRLSYRRQVVDAAGVAGFAVIGETGLPGQFLLLLAPSGERS